MAARLGGRPPGTVDVVTGPKAVKNMDQLSTSHDTQKYTRGPYRGLFMSRGPLTSARGSRHAQRGCAVPSVAGEGLRPAGEEPEPLLRGGTGFAAASALSLPEAYHRAAGHGRRWGCSQSYHQYFSGCGVDGQPCSFT